MKPNKAPFALEGIDNFRDLGNAWLKPGLVYRSGCLSRATASDLAQLQALGITTVLDLRLAPVREQKPDQLLSTMRHMPLCEGITEVLDALSAKPRSIKECASQPPGERSKRNYRTLVSSYAPVFARALNKIAQADSPLLFHCEMGKDRAGLLAAILYTLMGTPQEVILDDYLYSNTAMAAVDARDLARFSGGLSAMEQESLRALFEVRAEYLAEFFSEVDRQYGSFDQYVKEGLEMRDDAIARLKARLSP